MAAKAVEGEQLLKNVEMYQRRLAELTRQVRERPDTLGQVNAGLQCLIEGRTHTIPAAPTDAYAEYRQIKGLIFIGPKEWEKAMTSRDRRNRNPLGLEPNWCPQPDVRYSTDQMQKLVELCLTPEWSTTPILWLALPEVAGTPTSLVGQYSWWGVPHDSMGPGNVRKDVFWTNWPIGRRDGCDWKNVAAVTEPTWMLGFEHPRWTTEKNWSRQQEVAADHAMSISTVAQDALMLNLRLASAGKRLRPSTWSRTSTIYVGYPLNVRSYGHGVLVSGYWYPDDANVRLAASVQGMPSEPAFGRVGPFGP